MAARKVMVAIHGIGDQFRYETIQSVTNQVCRYFGEPAAVPLGRLHSTLFVEEPTVQATLDRLNQAVAALQPGAPPLQPSAVIHPPPAALLLTPPGPQLPAEIGFAEVYWADIPRTPAKDAHILEESKKWAQTVVERVRLQFQPQVGAVHLDDEDYRIAATAIGEMIETLSVLDRLLFLADKAGVFRFDLNKVLIDYLGDVQVVAEFASYRDQILKAFASVMERIDATMAETEAGVSRPLEIYLVAHSEGTVIAFMGLLRAFSNPDRPVWIDNVQGLMTISSPINKHLILWPELWTDFLRDKPHGPVPPPAKRIKWRNYYDFGDPVGFELRKTRDWLRDERWDTFFEFQGGKDEPGGADPGHDFGFARYPFPGKAHIDYWTDDAVFGHFVQTVVEPKDAADQPLREVKDAAGKLVWKAKDYQRPPATKWRYAIISPLLPYLLMIVLCYVGVYILYKSVAGFLQNPPKQPSVVLMDVLGLTGILASVIVCARLPRLTKLKRVRARGFVLLLAAAFLYDAVVSWDTKKILASWHDLVGLPLTAYSATASISLIALAVALVAIAFSGGSAYYGGTRLLIVLGGLAIAFLVGSAYYHHRHVCESDDCLGPVWPLLLASAAFLYLWWLAALIFDLTFVWHRYIRNSLIEDRLRSLVPKNGGGVRPEIRTL